LPIWDRAADTAADAPCPTGGGVGGLLLGEELGQIALDPGQRGLLGVHRRFDGVAVARQLVGCRLGALGVGLQRRLAGVQVLARRL